MRATTRVVDARYPEDEESGMTMRQRVRQSPIDRSDRAPVRIAGAGDVPPSPRDGVVIAGGLLLVAGAWLVLAPFVLRYGTGDAIWNDMACGAAILMLSLVQIASPRAATTPGWLT